MTHKTYTLRRKYRNHFWLGTDVVFDSYDSKNSKKVAEQLRQTKKALSRGVLFDWEMKTVKYKHPSLQTQQIHLNKLNWYARGSVIKSDSRSVVIIGTDTDYLLAMLVSQRTWTSDITLYISGNNLVIHYTWCPGQVIGNMKAHLITLHAATGCDTTSALIDQGKIRSKAMRSVRQTETD